MTTTQNEVDELRKQIHFALRDFALNAYNASDGTLSLPNIKQNKHIAVFERIALEARIDELGKVAQLAQIDDRQAKLLTQLRELSNG